MNRGDQVIRPIPVNGTGLHLTDREERMRLPPGPDTGEPFGSLRKGSTTHSCQRSRITREEGS
jgi:hypothetical protein